MCGGGSSPRSTLARCPIVRSGRSCAAEYQDLKGFAGDFTGSEWAGATFEPENGNWLFANLQSPGVTFAITGPWRRGAL
jgi:hypothetical protein